jgi:hypothetical protein
MSRVPPCRTARWPADAGRAAPAQAMPLRRFVASTLRRFDASTLRRFGPRRSAPGRIRATIAAWPTC